MAAKPGAPNPYKPTDADRAIVRQMAMVGKSLGDIGQVLGICDDTVGKYYREDVAAAKHDWKVEFEAKVKERALSPDCSDAFMKFMAQSQLGYSLPPTRVQAEIHRNIDEVSDEELIAIATAEDNEGGET